ncbi:hypothetical protein Tco_1511056, partial [Tanacetum coccineum]
GCEEDQEDPFPSTGYNVILTPHNGQQASSQVLPVNFDGLADVSMLVHIQIK